MEIEDTSQLHEPFQSHDSFESLLREINSLRNTHEQLVAIEGLGREIEEELPNKYSYHAHLEIGWIRLLWEAHHEEAIIQGVP